MENIGFVVSSELKSTLKAAGVPLATESPFIPPCPLSVGDVIAYPGPVALALRVKQRWFSPEDEKRPARWFVELEQVPHPLSLMP